MGNTKRLAIALLLLVTTVVACTGPGSAVARGINVGNRALDFALQSLDGKQVSLNDYKGNVVLINFWATWCGPCRAEIPDFEAAYRTHKGAGFVVLGINLQESPQTIEPFVASMDMTYPVLLDESGQVMAEYRARGLPMSLILDRDGVIQVRHMGFLTAGQLDDYLAQLLP